MRRHGIKRSTEKRDLGEEVGLVGGSGVGRGEGGFLWSRAVGGGKGGHVPLTSETR